VTFTGRERPSRIALELETLGGIPGWRDRSVSAEVRFLGRSAGGGRGAALPADWVGEKRLVAHMHQVHGATVLVARAGASGEGDAMVTSQSGLALVVVTADCVPILVAATDRVAAIHAGWRGLVGGVIPAALRCFDDPGRLTAWIGPAIGPCCYEVGEEVAGPVVARSSSAVRMQGSRGRPHLDLPLAAEIELARCGVGEIRRLGVCTFCHAGELESYRREGAGAGRNRSAIWLRARAESQDL
jgi:YfiH family protein